MAEMRDEDGWTTTCAAARMDHEDVVHTLVVKTDQESFYSYVYRLVNFDVPAEDLVAYETDCWLTSLWISPTGKLYAVDANGRIHSNRTGSWVTTDLNRREGLTWIWGLDDDTVFACGRLGAIVRLLGTNWQLFNANVDGNLYGLHGSAADDLYAVGEEGRIFHFDGKRWQRMPTPTNHILNAVFCRSKDEVYVCGEKGLFFEGARSRWTRIDQTSDGFHSLALFQDKLYVGAGIKGLYAYDGKALSLQKDNIPSYKVGSSSRYLTTAGSNKAARYDGTRWRVRTYT